MALFGDRIKVTCSTTGSTATTLTLGSAVSGFQTLSEGGLSNGDSVRYVIEDGSNFEIGLGTYATGSPDTLTGRSDANVSASSNSNNRINLSGSSTLFIAPTAADLQTVHVYSATSDLPSASDNHGMIAHVHGIGRMVFAHGGNWINLANASEITSYTHPNHSGEVTSTGDGATVIADNVVDEANLKVSNSPTDGYVLTARSGNTGGLTWEAASGGGGGGGGSTASALTEQEFTVTSNGTTLFTVTNGITNADNVVVFLNGSRLADSDIASISTSAGTVTLAAGATSGDIVTVSEFGAAFGSQYSSNIFTVGTSSEYNTTSKVLTTDYTATKVAVYLNGVKLLVGTDCTATNGTTIDLTNAAPVTGDKIEVVEHGTLADSVTTLTGLSDTPSSLGTAGQILQVASNGSSLEFASAGGGVTYYANVSNLPSSGNSNGDAAFVGANNRLYIYNGSGWYSVALLNQTPTISSVADANSNTTPFTLSSSGTATVITVTATDPEGLPLTYNYSVSSGALNGSTVTQNNNVFTVTPHASNAATFSLTFTATDGINTATSAAQSFTLSFTSWANAAQQQKLKASDAQASDNFGCRVGISSNGNTAIVGALREDAGGTDAGAAYIFARSGTTWSQQQKLVASNPSGNDKFGDAVAISGDGNTAIVGAKLEDGGGSNAGAAYIFTLSGSTWSQQQLIRAGDIQANDRFGTSVSISNDGNTVIIGAPREDTGATDAGAAYIWTRSGTTWTQQQKIQASDAGASANFAETVCLSNDGNNAIVGAYNDDENGVGAGAAYVFTRSGTTWSEEDKLVSSDIAAGDNFGWSVSISSDGDTAIVGANYEGTNGTNSGSAYVFTRSGTTWSQQQKINASNASSNDYFGVSVSISGDGDTAVVGAWQADATSVTDCGVMYIFQRSGTTWSEQDKISGSDTAQGDQLGIAVSLSNDGSTAIAGASYEDTTATDSGAAYIFVEG